MFINKNNKVMKNFIDSLDEWLYNEMGLMGGCCSSIDSLKYTTARIAVEKLLKEIQKEKEIKSFEDLAGKNVAVKNGTAGADFANSIKDKYGFKVTVFEDSPTMYQDVILGNSVACVEDTPIMADNIKTGGLALKIPEGMESEGSPYGFAIMNKANQPLLDMFNAGLKNIRENGTYQAILDKYLK